ncbi:uncharacterized protein LOC122036221 [Zingiber officinale]|uniref:uncharacterized protein LOC122036221 n=1 Tax=Zingiber officinale TaxID=94328 RepID=UPI001C4AC3B4|nr:uncharacterized protein LOC122036221 [Zingiber officinale]
MEEVGKLTTVTLTPKDLELLVNARVQQRLLLQQQANDGDPLPKRYQNLNIGEYSGTTDPEDHLLKFENAALLQQFTDGVKCRMFLTTFGGSTQRWFKRLPENSIRRFKDFRKVFLHHFSSNRRYYKTPGSLFSLKQGLKETLWTYIKRFNQVAMEVAVTATEILVNAFSQGLTDNDFFRDLARRQPANFDFLLDRASEFINVEEAPAARKKEATAPAPALAVEKPTQAAPPLRETKAHPQFRQQEPRPQVVQHVEVPQEAPLRWCTYHQTFVHSIESCYT